MWGSDDRPRSGGKGMEAGSIKSSGESARVKGVVGASDSSSDVSSMASGTGG